MKIKGIHICDCNGAVGHNDDCLRKSWDAAIKSTKKIQRCLCCLNILERSWKWCPWCGFRIPKNSAFQKNID